MTISEHCIHASIGLDGSSTLWPFCVQQLAINRSAPSGTILSVVAAGTTAHDPEQYRHRVFTQLSASVDADGASVDVLAAVDAVGRERAV